MPSFRKLSAAETAVLDQPPIGARAELVREYDAYMAEFALGDYGRAELHEGERRAVVRRRLHAAADRRGLALHFRSGRGPLTFRVVAPLISATQPQEIVEAAAMAEGRSLRPPRPMSRRQSAAERYHDMLPRSLREGQQGGGGTAQRNVAHDNQYERIFA